MAPLSKSHSYSASNSIESSALLDTLSRRSTSALADGTVEQDFATLKHRTPLSSYISEITPDADILLSRRDPSLFSALQPRQNQNGEIFAIPLSYNLSGSSPAQVVGITLGTVGGLILIIVLFWAVFNMRGDAVIEADTMTEYEVTRRSRSSGHRSRRTRRTEQRTEMSDVSSIPPPPRRAPRRERVIVQETTRRTERSQPPPMVREPSLVSPERERMPEPPPERRVDGDDVVEVIEEQSSLSSVPVRKSKRKSGYRTVDPNAYAGGNFAERDVYESRRNSRRY